LNGDLSPIIQSRHSETVVHLGSGVARSHHGELLQGAFSCDGRIRRGLVTLPCPLFSSQATVHLDPALSVLAVQPEWKTKALRAAMATISRITDSTVGGLLTIHSDVAVGLGFGSSTSDVTASIRAVCTALGTRLPDTEIARIAVEAESAVDPLMFDAMMLFAHRDGEIIESFETTLPELGVLGFRLNIGAVDTLRHPPARYTPQEISALDTLLDRLRTCLASGDVAGLGAVATASARLNQRFLPIPGFDTLTGIADSVAAAGIQIAHSGNIAGLLFDPSDEDVEHRRALAAKSLSALGFTDSWYYTHRSDDGDGPPARTASLPDQPTAKD